MAVSRQNFEPVFPRETVESFSGNLLLINKVMKISLTMAESLRGWEKKWSEERRMWSEERTRLKTLSEKSKESQEGVVSSSEDTMKKVEKPREGIDTPISEGRWEEELEIRIARKIAIASMDVGIAKRNVLDMLKQMLGRKMEEDKVVERACEDGITTWHARLESADEAKKILAEEAAIRREHKIEVSPESTFLQRQTRQIVERRADSERLARKQAKIKTDGAWLCIDEKWETWLEKEARWASEDEWNQRRRRDEIARAEKRLERLRREEERAAGHERRETQE